MTPEQYPALWRSSNAASEASQYWYLTWVRAHLVLLAAAGLFAAWTPGCEADNRIAAGIVALMMFAALIVGLVIQLGRMDEAWFRARAFAENAKDIAWRFMMRPRPQLQADAEADEGAFLDELQQVRGRFPQVEKHLSKHDGGGEELTPIMRHARTMPMAERLKFYLEHRLDDQIEWYRAKAKENAKAESRWFAYILVAEALAIIAAVVRMLGVHEYNPTGGIAAVAACFVAWVQAKRFADLSNAYGVACRDLNGLRTKSEHVHDETQLAKFVQDVEQAISREHRLWTERRAEY